MFHFALLWHHHQPMYKDLGSPTQAGSYLHPWVRLHTLRDYYSMAALVAEHPTMHLTINLTPALLWQITDYVEHGATDQALELTLKPAEMIDAHEREQILSTFFDAHWHNQIFPHPRYKELFNQRQQGLPFTIQDLRDLQMWFHLAWFGSEFRSGHVRLITNEVASVSRFIEQERDFTSEDIQAMVEMQYRIMRAVILVHRHLQERGQIEIATTPFSHPILPLLVDTDLATIDRPGASYPRRFSHPEDADAQVRLAIESYQQHFGRLPQGMWPAEGAVSQQIVPIFALHGIRWIATDKGVLARSGRWGYTVDDPNVLCQPYCVQENEQAVSIFFRDTHLSDAIGFRYAAYGAAQAAQDFLQEIKERFVRKIAKNTDRVITVILDGENAWGAYRDDARPFLHALYEQLGEDQELRTVTFAEYLTGNVQRGIAPHPLEEQTCISDLFPGSWIDENGSAPGVDLGTWIGEREENRGWELLGQTRDDLSKAGVTPQAAPAAFEALYLAEGSDWFWWLGEDQDSVNDSQFDDLFRTHLKQVYRCLGSQPPTALDQHIVPRTRLWTFTQPLPALQLGDRLTIRTNCPGVLTWSVDGEQPVTVEMIPAGGVMAGAQRYSVTVGPIPEGAHAVCFRFSCTHAHCSYQPAFHGTNLVCVI